MDDMLEKLDREINTQIENLALMENGTQEKERATQHLTELMKMRETIENDKTAAKQSRRFNMADLVVKGVGVVVSGVALVSNVWLAIQGFDFEREGTFTSKTMNNLMSKINRSEK